MRRGQRINQWCAAARKHPIELGAHAVIWGAFLVLMARGDSNGVGYFRQPGHSLIFPLLHGALWNMATFLAAGLVLLPRLLARRWQDSASALATLAALVLTGKTLGEFLYVRLAVPDLRVLSPLELGLENVYSFAAALLFGLLYFVARRGITLRGFRRSESITVRSGTTRHRLQVDALRYLKAEGNYVAFHTGRRPLWVLTTMTAALEHLPAERFLRIHRSFAINLARVTGLSGDAVVIDDERLPIGRTYIHETRNRVNAWLERR